MQFLCDDKRHLVCLPYSVANLHQMAAALGINKCWYHGGDKPHYDIPKLQIARVRAACQVVSPRAILHIIQHGHLPEPARATY